ncbi:MAG: GUN4 domain-containing protein [Synechococcaceae cyanobacterium]|nr:GUN4 domain-containing protein [Synechococcaceae cyanobacterium]
MLSGPPVSPSLAADQLLERFLAGSPRQRRTLLPQLEGAAEALIPLIPASLDRLDATGDDWAAGWLLQLLLRRGDESACAAVQSRYPDGWLVTPSAAGIKYAPLQRALLGERFEEADRLTSAHLRQLAGPDAERRGYVYYSEVARMPGVDLENLDRLWLVYSRGRFGFSVQGRLLRACGGQWEKLWPRLGWKSQGVWTRYPGSFTWSLEAPDGHMPLVNQLRGVRLMDALLRHPALARRIEAAAG